MLAVLHRELRVEARKPGQYWMRVVAGSSVLAMLVVQMIAGRVGGGDGAALFAMMQQAILVMIMLFVPLTTADCISRERREGTLFLLGLTPLTPLGVLLAKVASRLIAILGWMLPAIPMLVIPVLLGGVGSDLILFGLTVDVAMLAVALGVGMLASAGAERWGVAMVRGLWWSYFFSLLYLVMAIMFLTGESPDGIEALGLPVLVVVHMPSALSYFSAKGGEALVAFASAGAILCTVALVICSGSLRSAWRQEPPSAEAQAARNFFIKPLLLPEVFRGLRRHRLRGNPVAWLQGFSTRARVIKWGLLLVVTVAETFLVFSRDLYSPMPQFILLGLLTFSVAFSASASLLNERQSGALELLLVTPLRPGQFIRGRFWAIVTDNALSLILVLVSLYLGLNTGYPYTHADQSPLPFVVVTGFVVTFLWWFVAAIGIYQSLVRKSVMAAFGATVALSLLVFGVGLSVLIMAGELSMGVGNMVLPSLLLLLGIVFLVVMPFSFLFGARRILTRREFSQIA